MERYIDRNGDSGIVAFEIGNDYIRVQFSTGAVYLYTIASAGAENIAEMQRLARLGDGLNSYINRKVRKGYAARER